VVLDTSALRIVAPALVHLAAMKLTAIRDDTDLDDAALLARRFRDAGQDADGVWAVVGGLVPVAERSKARYNLLKVWEMFDESE